MEYSRSDATNPIDSRHLFIQKLNAAMQHQKCQLCTHGKRAKRQADRYTLQRGATSVRLGPNPMQLACSATGALGYVP
jgi:hypothetical protein